MLPVMNIMFLLIPALLLSMEVASLAAIHVSPPAFSSHPVADANPASMPTSLHIRVYDDGFGIELAVRDVSPRMTIPLANPGAASDDPTRWDYAALQDRVDQLRPLFDAGTTLEISAEPQIRMQVLVDTIDAAQSRDLPLPLLVSAI